MPSTVNTGAPSAGSHRASSARIFAADRSKTPLAFGNRSPTVGAWSVPIIPLTSGEHLTRVDRVDRVGAGRSVRVLSIVSAEGDQSGWCRVSLGAVDASLRTAIR